MYRPETWLCPEAGSAKTDPRRQTGQLRRRWELAEYTCGVNPTGRMAIALPVAGASGACPSYVCRMLDRPEFERWRAAAKGALEAAESLDGTGQYNWTCF